MAQLESHEQLLRLSYAPEHILDGKILPAAVSTDDLKSRGFSLDIESLVNISTVRERVISQSSRLPEKRKESFISRFQHAKVLEITEESQAVFSVQHTPTEENFAHASLYCVKREEKPSYYKKARNFLIPLLEDYILLENYIKDGHGESSAQPSATTETSTTQHLAESTEPAANLKL